ncbi:hypothetical protein H0H92_008406 [Tricholoma furcatifolium]|nr:hypothetical protein H0H92_008406 [Tricholoma furcatifolium]
MTPSEREFLQNLGTVVWQDFANHVGVALLYGMLTPLTIITVQKLVEHRGLSSLRTKATLGVLLFAFITATGFLWSSLMPTITLIQWIMVDNIAVPLEEKLGPLNTRTYTWDVVAVWFQLFPPLTNDALIIWRAWVLFDRKRWALYILLVLWAASVGTSLTYAAITSIPGVHYEASALEAAAVYSIDAGTTLSFATNFLASAFIGYVLWGHWKTIRKSQMAQDREKFRIVGSSDPTLNKFQLTAVVLGFTPVVANSNAYEGVEIYLGVYNMISAMYPTIVTFIVHGPLSIAGIHETATVVYQEGRNQYTGAEYSASSA